MRAFLYGVALGTATVLACRAFGASEGLKWVLTLAAGVCGGILAGWHEDRHAS